MATDYPTAIDGTGTLPNPSATSNTNSPSLSGGQTNQNDAIKALETKLGIGATTPSSSLPFLLGTGSDQSTWSSVAAAITALGLGTLATLNTVSLTANVSGILPTTNGGTGNSTGSAASVNGILANTTPTANELYPLNGSAVFPTAVLQSSVLGYAQITTTFTTTSTTSVQVTGLTATVTIPTLVGNQRVEVEFYVGDAFPAGATGLIDIEIWDGTVGSGTLLQQAEPNLTNSTAVPVLMKWSGTSLSAGSHTINIGLKKSASPTTAYLECYSYRPCWMQVKVV